MIHWEHLQPVLTALRFRVPWYAGRMLVTLTPHSTKDVPETNIKAGERWNVIFLGPCVEGFQLLNKQCCDNCHSNKTNPDIYVQGSKYEEYFLRLCGCQNTSVFFTEGITEVDHLCSSRRYRKSSPDHIDVLPNISMLSWGTYPISAVNNTISDTDTFMTTMLSMLTAFCYFVNWSISSRNHKPPVVKTESWVIQRCFCKYMPKVEWNRYRYFVILLTPSKMFLMEPCQIPLTSTCPNESSFLRV